MSNRNRDKFADKFYNRKIKPAYPVGRITGDGENVVVMRCHDRSFGVLCQELKNYIVDMDKDGYDLLSHSFLIHSLKLNDPKDHTIAETYNHTLTMVFKKRVFSEDMDSYIKDLEYLLEGRDRVMEAIPECPAHGHQCVPHALEWVERMKDEHPRSN